MVNTTQQVGGSLGTALLNTIFTTAVASFAAGHGGGPAARAEAAIHGYSVAFTVSAGLLAAGVLLVALFLRLPPQPPNRPTEGAGGRPSDADELAAEPALVH